MPKEIVPDVFEISLAYNPMNEKKFLMLKDDSHKKLLKGEEVMEKLIAILKDEGQLPNEADFIAALQKAKIPEETLDLMKGAFRFVVKSNLEKDVLETLAGFFIPVKAADESSIRAEIKKDLETSIRAELKKEFDAAKGGQDEAVTMLKDQVTKLSKDLAATSKLLDVEKDARRLGELRVSVKEMNLPGDIEKIAKTLLMAEKSNPELAKDITETLKTTGEAFAAAGVFSEIGDAGAGQEMGKAYDELHAKKVAFMKENAATSETDAWREVCRANPKLYKAYSAEHSAKGGTH